MFRNARSGFLSIQQLRSSIALLSSLILLLVLTGCGGGDKESAEPKVADTNSGGGYTLKAAGGTLNDGSGTSGLAVLVTLRDSEGNGPGAAAGWTISISGPGIDLPLVVDYEDGSPSSYSTWWWESFGPVSGSYTAVASNSTTTLQYSFQVDAAKNLSKPVINKSGNVITWNAIPDAGSYYYRVSDGKGILLDSGYHGADPLYSSYSIYLPVLTDGSYAVEVFAHTTNRVLLQEDISAAPLLAAQENISAASLDIVVGGTGSGYALDARGGVLYEGTFNGADHYGLVIWTSILTNAAVPSAPASPWDISVTGPGITTPITFAYPATASHYAYWDFGAIPGSGTYTVTAVVRGGSASVTQTFTIPSPAAKLPLATGLSATPAKGGGASITWDAVAGANSYYINVWTMINDVYTEIAGKWVTSTSATIVSGTLAKGVEYDAYVTASGLNMTDTKSVPLPVTPGSQVNMSDTTFTYTTFTAL